MTVHHLIPTAVSNELLKSVTIGQPGNVLQGPWRSPRIDRDALIERLHLEHLAPAIAARMAERADPI